MNNTDHTLNEQASAKGGGHRPDSSGHQNDTNESARILERRVAGWVESIGRCLVFMSPGPPWYGAQCRRLRGHEEEHDFGTKEEAQKRWESANAQHERRGLEV